MFKKLQIIIFICLFLLFAQIGCSGIGYIDTIEPVESAGWIEAKPYSSFKSYLYKCDTFEIRIGYVDIEEGIVAFGPPVLPVFPGPEPTKESIFELNVFINNKKLESEFYKTIPTFREEKDFVDMINYYKKWTLKSNYVDSSNLLFV